MHSSSHLKIEALTQQFDHFAKHPHVSQAIKILEMLSSTALSDWNLLSLEKKSLLLSMIINNHHQIETYLSQDQRQQLNQGLKSAIHALFTDEKHNLLELNARLHIYHQATTNTLEKKIFRFLPVLRSADLATYESISGSITKNKSLEPRYNPTKATINRNEYQSIMKIKKIIDTSELILLMTGLIQSEIALKQKHTKMPSEMEAHLNKMYQHYLKNTYLDALSETSHFFEKYSQYFDNSLKKLLLDNLLNHIDVDPQKNDVRRFFENRLSQFYYGMIVQNKEMCPTGILGQNADKLEVIEDKISNFLRAYTKDKNPEIFQLADTLMTKSPNFRHRKKHRKYAFDDQAYSSNLGVLKSTSPNYTDEVNLNSAMNRNPDKTSINKDTSGFSDDQTPALLISGLSGHTFFLIAVLDHYMRQHHQDPHLENDINNFIKAYIAIYISRGYHGLDEITAVLEGEPVKDLFKHHRVKLNYDFPDIVLQNAIKDTQEYAKTICLRRALQASLKSETKLVDEKITPFWTSSQPRNTLSKSAMPNTETTLKNRDGDTKQRHDNSRKPK
jgi:hypothetical protein